MVGLNNVQCACVLELFYLKCATQAVLALSHLFFTTFLLQPDCVPGLPMS